MSAPQWLPLVIRPACLVCISPWLKDEEGTCDERSVWGRGSDDAESGAEENINGEKVVSEQVSEDVYARVIGSEEKVNGDAEEEKENDDEKQENGVKEVSSDFWLEVVYGFPSISEIAERL